MSNASESAGGDKPNSGSGCRLRGGSTSSGNNSATPPHQNNRQQQQQQQEQSPSGGQQQQQAPLQRPNKPCCFCWCCCCSCSWAFGTYRCRGREPLDTNFCTEIKTLPSYSE
ncbi:hypothetical protein L798_10036 [Zootermopsis nevadensis]|uniref:Uncharacterized protein n=1 Tax=Zootermopsis nevadensis TaxID=136037 RepID=A0A067R0T5_ZOONE|nr:hypothetical protein L798_10036 [Zootermopsis nevadensis]